MVGSIAKYSYLNAKIKAKTGKMLTAKDYKELMSKKTVSEAASYLKNKTYYSKVLKDMDENNIHRGVLETALKKDQCRRALKLMRLIKGKESNFLRYNLLRYEIEDIKMMIRVLHRHENLEEIESSLFTLEKCNINLDKLLSSKSIEDFINNLQGTVYYDILYPLVESDSNINMFTIETALDLYYYQWVIHAKNKYLTGDDKKIITMAVGEEIDILNMFWIYRIKKYYHMDKELIYRYLIPGSYRIKKDMYQKMIETDGIEELLNIYKNTHYSKIFDEDKDINYGDSYWLHVMKMHEILIKTKPYSIASIISYLHLKEIEIKVITTIIEGIRYGLPPDKVESYISYLKV